MTKIETITAQSFAPFGTLLRFGPDQADSRFEITNTEAQAGWRLAIFRVTARSAARLECHPHSLESFIPCGGTGVLLCAAPGCPNDLHAFLLDQPVCLHKGTWHEVVALSDEALYQITENLEVSSEFHEFALPVTVAAQ